MAESFSFFLDMKTNVPAVVQSIIGSLNQLQSRGKLSMPELQGTAQGAALEKFVKDMETAGRSGQTLQQQLQTLKTSFAQLAASAPDVAAAFNLKDLETSLRQFGGVSRSMFDPYRENLNRVIEASRLAANSGVTGFQATERSLLEINKTLTDSLRLLTQMESIEKRIGAAVQPRKGETPEAQFGRLSGTVRPDQTRTPGTLQRAVDDIGKLDFSTGISNLKRLSAALTAGAKEFAAAGNTDAARKFTDLAVGVKKGVSTLQTIQTSQVGNLARAQTDVASIKRAHDAVSTSLTEIAGTAGQTLTRALSKSLVQGVSHVQNAVLRELGGAAQSRELKDASRRVSAALSQAMAESSVIKQTPVGKATERFAVPITEGAANELRTAVSNLLTEAAKGVGTRFVQETDKNVQAAARVERDAARAATAGSALAGALVQDAQAMGGATQAAREHKAAIDAAAKAQSEADRQAIRGAQVPKAGTRVTAGESALKTLGQTLDQFDRATTDAGRQSALNAIPKQLDNFNKAMASAQQRITDAGQALKAVSPEGQTKPAFIDASTDLAELTTRLQALRAALGQVSAGVARAEAQQRAALATSAQLKADRADDALIRSAQKRRQQEANAAARAATSGLDTLMAQVKRFATITTPSRQAAAAQAIEATYDRIRIQAERANVLLGEAKGAQSTLTPAGRAAPEQRAANVLLAETQGRVTAATNAESKAQAELAAVQQKVTAATLAAAQAATSLADAKVGSSDWFTAFREGFKGQKEGPEVIGQTARISLLYGTAYRLLGVLSQIASDAFASLTEFQVGLSEMSEILHLSSEEVHNFGRAVLESSAATGVAAEDLLKATQRVTLAGFGPAGGPEGGGAATGGETVAFAVDASRALADLSVISKETADNLSVYLSAIASATGETGNFSRSIGDAAAYVSKQTGPAVQDLLKAVARVGDMGTAVGLTSDELLAMAGVIQSATGQSADAVGGYLSQIFSRVGEANTTAALRGAGVDTSKDFLDQMKQLNTALTSGRASSQQAAEIANAFGRGSVGNALLTLARGMDRVTTLAGGARTEAAGTLSERASKQLDGFAGQLGEMRGQVEQLIITIGLMGETFTYFLQVVNMLLDGLNGILGTLAKLNVTLPVLGETNLVGGFIALAAAIKFVPPAFRFVTGSANAAATALTRLAMAAPLGSRATPGRGIPGLPGYAAGEGREITKFGKFLRFAGGAAGVFTAVATAAQVFNSEMNRVDEAVKATTDSLKGLGSADAGTVREALSADAIQTSLDSVQQQFEDAGKTWMFWARGGIKNQLENVQAQLEYAQKLSDSTSDMFRKAFSGQRAIDLADPDTLQKQLDEVWTKLVPTGTGVDVAGQSVGELTGQIRDRLTAAGTALDDALNKAITDGLVNVSDGLSPEEITAAATAMMKEVDTSGFNQEQLTVLMDVLKQRVVKAFDSVTAALGSVSAAANDAIGEIDRLSADFRALTFSTPLVTTKGIAKTGPIKDAIANLAILQQEMVGQTGDELVSSLAGYAAEADKVKDMLDAQMRQAQLVFAGREDSAPAIKTFAQIMQDQVLASGGEVTRIAELFANSNDAIVNQMVETMRAELAALKVLLEKVRKRISAARIAMADLAGLSPSGTMPRPGLDVSVAQDKAASAMTEEEKAWEARARQLEKGLDATDAVLSSMGRSIIGAADRIGDSAKGAGETAAQIAAAAAIADATRTGGKIQMATAQLQKARADLNASKAGTVAYFTALAGVYEAQNGLASAIIEVADTARRVGSDLTDPIEQAQLDLARAQAAVQDAVNRGKALDVVQSLQLEERQAANALEETKFREFLSQLDTNRELGRITDLQRIAALDAEKARLEAIVDRTYQQQQQLDEVEKALKAAANEMEGQFNLGDIRLPTVYQVRRYIQTATAGLDFLGQSLADIINASPLAGLSIPSAPAVAPAQSLAGQQMVVNNNIRIDGADVGMVKRVIVGALGASESGRLSSTLRKY